MSGLGSGNETIGDRFKVSADIDSILAFSMDLLAFHRRNGLTFNTSSVLCETMKDQKLLKNIALRYNDVIDNNSHCLRFHLCGHADQSTHVLVGNIPKYTEAEMKIKIFRTEFLLDVSTAMMRLSPSVRSRFKMTPYNNPDNKLTLKVHEQDMEAFYDHLKEVREEQQRRPVVYFKYQHGMQLSISAGLDEMLLLIDISENREIYLQLHAAVNIFGKQKEGIFIKLKNIKHLAWAGTVTGVIKYPYLSDDVGHFSHLPACRQISANVSQVNAYMPAAHAFRPIEPGVVLSSVAIGSEEQEFKIKDGAVVRTAEYCSADGVPFIGYLTYIETLRAIGCPLRVEVVLNYRNFHELVDDVTDVYSNIVRVLFGEDVLSVHEFKEVHEYSFMLERRVELLKLVTFHIPRPLTQKSMTKVLRIENDVLELFGRCKFLYGTRDMSSPDNQVECLPFLEDTDFHSKMVPYPWLKTLFGMMYRILPKKNWEHEVLPQEYQRFTKIERAIYYLLRAYTYYGFVNVGVLGMLPQRLFLCPIKHLNFATVEARRKTFFSAEKNHPFYIGQDVMIQDVVKAIVQPSTYVGKILTFSYFSKAKIESMNLSENLKKFIITEKINIFPTWLIHGDRKKNCTSWSKILTELPVAELLLGDSSQNALCPTLWSTVTRYKNLNQFNDQTLALQLLKREASANAARNQTVEPTAGAAAASTVVAADAISVEENLEGNLPQSDVKLALRPRIVEISCIPGPSRLQQKLPQPKQNKRNKITDEQVAMVVEFLVNHEKLQDFQSEKVYEEAVDFINRFLPDELKIRCKANSLYQKIRNILQNDIKFRTNTFNITVPEEVKSVLQWKI